MLARHSVDQNTKRLFGWSSVGAWGEQVIIRSAWLRTGLVWNWVPGAGWSHCVPPTPHRPLLLPLKPHRLSRTDLASPQPQHNQLCQFGCLAAVVRQPSQNSLAVPGPRHGAGTQAGRGTDHGEGGLQVGGAEGSETNKETNLRAWKTDFWNGPGEGGTGEGGEI